MCSIHRYRMLNDYSMTRIESYCNGLFDDENEAESSCQCIDRVRVHQQQLTNVEFHRISIVLYSTIEVTSFFLNKEYAFILFMS
jgi:hypothetical protein